MVLALQLLKECGVPVLHQGFFCFLLCDCGFHQQYECVSAYASRHLRARCAEDTDETATRKRAFCLAQAVLLAAVEGAEAELAVQASICSVGTSSCPKLANQSLQLKAGQSKVQASVVLRKRPSVDLH